MRVSDNLETNDEIVQATPKCDILLQTEHFRFPDEVECVRLYADWEIRNVGINCELDLVVYCCDDRVSVLTLTAKSNSCKESPRNHLQCFR